MNTEERRAYQLTVWRANVETLLRLILVAAVCNVVLLTSLLIVAVAP